MNVAVFFKVLPDFDRFFEKDWREVALGCYDWGRVRQVFNAFEESALEMALKLADRRTARRLAVELTALTMDDSRADLFLQQLRALNYDQTVRVAPGDGPDLRFNPMAVSRVIAAYVQQFGQDVLFFGAQGGSGDNRQTGYLTAERLGWPCIRDVADMDADAVPDALRVISRTRDGAMERTVSLPVVLIVGAYAESTYLRVPTLKQKLAASKTKATQLSLQDLDLNPEDMRDSGRDLKSLQPYPPKRQCVFIKGRDAREKAQHLYEQYLASRLNPDGDKGEKAP